MVIMGQLISLTSNPDGQTTYMHKGQKVKTKTNNMIVYETNFKTDLSNYFLISYITSVGKGLQPSRFTCQKMVLKPR